MKTISETGEQTVTGAKPHLPLGWWLDTPRQVVQMPFTPPAPTETTPPSSEKEQNWVAGGPIPFKIYPRRPTIKTAPPRSKLEQNWTAGGPLPVSVIEQTKYKGPTSSNRVHTEGPPPVGLDPPTAETRSTTPSSSKQSQTWNPNQRMKFGPAPPTSETKSTTSSSSNQSQTWDPSQPIRSGTKQETVLSNGEGSDEDDDDDNKDEDSDSSDADIGNDNNEDLFSDLFDAQTEEEDDEDEERL
ncbi:MAG: hypothetical protein LQ347_004092, partial [Umbilicaria vellea]